MPFNVEIREEIIDGLGENTSPIDGVDGTKVVLSVEFFIGEQRFYDVLDMRIREDVHGLSRIKMVTWQSSNVPLTAIL